jgi:hypothetical protein
VSAPANRWTRPTSIPSRSGRRTSWPVWARWRAATTPRRWRFGLPLSLADHLPDIAAYYRELCAAAGIKPLILMPGPVNRGMIYLHEDPDRAWAELGQHILWEAVTYGEWSTDQRSLMHLPGVETLDEVRASGRYQFLTPDQLIAEIRDSDNYGPLVMHPSVEVGPAADRHPATGAALTLRFGTPDCARGLRVWLTNTNSTMRMGFR